MPNTDSLSRTMGATGPQSPQSLYEGLKYIIAGPNAPDSDHLRAAAQSIHAHHEGAKKQTLGDTLAK